MHSLKNYSNCESVPNYASIVDWLSRTVALLKENNKNHQIKDIQDLVQREYQIKTWEYDEIMKVVDDWFLYI